MTLVMLPGMMCDERLFVPQIQAFPDAVIFVSKDEHTITGMAQTILDQSPDTFDLMGLSMGGIIAMEIVRLAPKRVNCLALMDTNYLAELDTVKAIRDPQMTAVKNGHLQAVMRDEMKPRYLADGPNKADILDTCMDMATDLGADAFINQSHALMARRDQSDTLTKLTCPTLILCGEYDNLCPVSRHQEMAELVPHATLEIIENAGHLPTLENPTDTTTALSRWRKAS